MRNIVFFALVSVLMLNLAFTSHSKALTQSDLPQLEQQVRRLIEKAEIKQLLVKDITQSGNIRGEVLPKGPIFGHIALDLFSDTDVCVTVDFTYGPLKGVLSLLFRWEGPTPILVDKSYWLVRTEVGGDISSDTTWTPEKSPYYVTSNVNIWDGVTLTIQPGTVVRFRKFSTLERIQIWVSQGTLLSQGTDANLVTFTTNCDFEELDEIQSMSQESSDWEGIRAHWNGNITLNHTILEYANWGINTWEREGQIIVSNSTFRKCTNGIGTWGRSSVTVTNNTISDCWDRAIYVDFQGVPDAGGDIAGNTITMRYTWRWAVMDIRGGIPNISGNQITGPFDRGIYSERLGPSALITGNMINSPGPDRSNVGISVNTGECTISGNEVTGYFSHGIGVENFYGVVTENTIISPPGSSWSGISAWRGEPTISDNTIGSDAEGYFDVGIYLEDVGPAGLVSGNTITAPTGDTRPHAILIRRSSPTVDANSIYGAFDQVIRVDEGSNATIINHKLIQGNYGVYCVNSQPHINYNNIEGNTNWGVFNETPYDYTVDAENNWWGDASGPSAAGPGTGDAISFGVDFEPWLLEPVTQ